MEQLECVFPEKEIWNVCMKTHALVSLSLLCGIVLNFTMIEVLIRANQKMSLLQRVKQFSLLSLEIEFIN